MSHKINLRITLLGHSLPKVLVVNRHTTRRSLMVADSLSYSGLVLEVHKTLEDLPQINSNSFMQY